MKQKTYDLGDNNYITSKKSDNIRSTIREKSKTPNPHLKAQTGLFNFDELPNMNSNSNNRNLYKIDSNNTGADKNIHNRPPSQKNLVKTPSASYQNSDLSKKVDPSDKIVKYSSPKHGIHKQLSYEIKDESQQVFDNIVKYNSLDSSGKKHNRDKNVTPQDERLGYGYNKTDNPNQFFSYKEIPGPDIAKTSNNIQKTQPNNDPPKKIFDMNKFSEIFNEKDSDSSEDDKRLNELSDKYKNELQSKNDEGFKSNFVKDLNENFKNKEYGNPSSGSNANGSIRVPKIQNIVIDNSDDEDEADMLAMEIRYESKNL